MGCHTWFYKKIKPQPTYQEVKEQVLERFVDGNIELYQQMIDGTLEDDIKDAYPEWNKEMGMRYLPVMERIRRRIEGDFCKVAVCNRYEHDEDLTTFEFDTFYVSTDELPHDLFRIGHYPENKLYSLYQTMKFINENKEKMSFCDDWEKYLQEFWMKNPDGMIQFG
jgi:hypothetical protein